MFVAGTDTSGQFWTPSDFYRGGTKIAAPATSILTLADPTGFPTGTVVGEGTSFAAPFVAGVAGMLLAMDPNLTGSQITDYILRGARQPRLDPQTGQITPPDSIPVPGDTAAVYLLDA